MATNNISFTLEYTANLAQGPEGTEGSERFPVQLEVVGTHELSPDLSSGRGVWIETLKKPAAAHRFEVKLNPPKQQTPFLPYREGGAYEKTYDLYDKTGESLAHSTAIIVRAYATTYSKSGQACLTAVGEAVFPMRELLKEGRMNSPMLQHHESKPSDDRKSPLMKGNVGLTIDEHDFPRVRQANKFDVDNTKNPVVPRLRKMVDLSVTCDNESTVFVPNPSQNELQPFNCSFFNTARVPLLPSAYAQLRPQGEINVPYYEQVLRIGRRRTFGPDDQMDSREGDVMVLGSDVLTGKATRSQIAAYGAYVARCATVFATSQVYVSSFVNRNSEYYGSRQYDPALVEDDEQFQVARRLGGGNANSMALECHMFVRQLQLSSPSLSNKMSPLLRQMRQFLRLYTSCITTCAVKKGGLSIYDVVQPGEVQRHTFCALIPLRTLYNAVDENTRMELEGSLAFQNNNVRIKRAPANLPILVCEGTALVDPAMGAVTDYYDETEKQEARMAEAAIEARRSFFERARELVLSKHPSVNVEIFRPPNRAQRDGPLSEFYKYVTTFSTADFNDIGLVEFTLAYSRDDERTHGVSFENFVAGEFYAEESTLLKDEDTKLLDAMLLDVRPIPNLQLPVDPETPNSRELDTNINKSKEALEIRRGRHTMLHSRQLVLTVRREDVTDEMWDDMFELASEVEVAYTKVIQYTLSQPANGTKYFSEIIDFYFNLV